MEDSEENPLDRSGGKREQEQAADTPNEKKQAARKRAPLRHLQSKSLSPQCQILT